MRTVYYVFTRHLETDSYTEAQKIKAETHLPYEVVLRDVPHQIAEMTPIRKAMINDFGYAHPKFRNLYHSYI